MHSDRSGIFRTPSVSISNPQAVDLVCHSQTRALSSIAQHHRGRVWHALLDSMTEPGNVLALSWSPGSYICIICIAIYLTLYNIGQPGDHDRNHAGRKGLLLCNFIYSHAATIENEQFLRTYILNPHVSIIIHPNVHTLLYKQYGHEYMTQ